jgi:prepilin signal peptidase PulO-like enzyme (type II secretory pathway)
MERAEQILANSLSSLDGFIAHFDRLIIGTSDDAAWLGFVVLVILAGTAWHDARTGKVPDLPLLMGGLLVALGQYWYGSWQNMLQQVGLGALAALVLWAINEAYYRLKKRDAFGMGDAKWTALGVQAFGVAALGWSWVLGAWLALLWMGLAKIFGHRLGRVYFAPFLAIGLILILFFL